MPEYAVPRKFDPTYASVSFDELEGWAADDHFAALGVFQTTCADFLTTDEVHLLDLARDATDARDYFERNFQPVLITDGQAPLFTGYFEPDLSGSPTCTGLFQFPIYTMPPEAKAIQPWHTRREILTSDVMQGRGLEIAWVSDPVELFFLQVQGSGRIRFPDGQMIRVGYGGSNGHVYSSIGQELVRRGVFSAHDISADAIKIWIRNNPNEGEALLLHNDRYIFFREVREIAADQGPLGTMNQSMTPMRSIAVDPSSTPLGAPVWVEKSGASPLRRLMIAQDTGSAIKGAQRADLFLGTGDAAGILAGQINDPGRMIVLLPKLRADAMLTRGAS